MGLIVFVVILFAIHSVSGASGGAFPFQKLTLQGFANENYHTPFSSCDATQDANNLFICKNETTTFLLGELTDLFDAKMYAPFVCPR